MKPMVDNLLAFIYKFIVSKEVLEKTAEIVVENTAEGLANSAKK